MADPARLIPASMLALPQSGYAHVAAVRLWFSSLAVMGVCLTPDSWDIQAGEGQILIGANPHRRALRVLFLLIKRPNQIYYALSNCRMCRRARARYCARTFSKNTSLSGSLS